MTGRRLGDVDVSPVALGNATLAFRGPQHDEEGVAAIRAAVDAGITLLDTALAYTRPGEDSLGERLVREALAGHPHRDAVVVATKGGHHRTGEQTWQVDGRPETLRQHCETSLRSLGVESLDLYQLHWPDPDVPLEESVGALEDLRQRGLVRRVGLSNVSVDQIVAARRTTTVTAVQNPLSPYDLTDLPTAQWCAREGIAYLAYSPLGSGPRARDLGQQRPAFAEVAASHGATPQQVALAWLLALAPTVVPVVGATRPETIRSSAAAGRLVLTADDLALLDAQVRDGGPAPRG